MENHVTLHNTIRRLLSAMKRDRLKGTGFLLAILLMLGSIQEANAQLTLTIGTGTATSYYYGPIYRSSATSSFDYSNYVYLYEAAELSSIPAGATIVGLAWEKSDAGSLTGTNFLEILLENTIQTSIGVSGNNYTTETASSTVVYSDNNYTVPGITGWLTHTLTNPFIYTGGNLKIGVGHVKSGTASGAINFYYEQATGFAGGVSSSSATVSSTFSTTYSDRRPNIQIIYTVPVIPNDAGVVSIDEPFFPSAPGLQDVKATINTIGVNNLTSCTINWSVNGVAQMPYSWTGNLAQYQNAGPITIGSFNFPQGVNEIMVWTSNPNNQVDSFPANDTATVSFLFTNPLSGTYTIGGPSADFNTFDEVATAFAAGMTAPVIFNVDSLYGPYFGGFELASIAGNSYTNSITFNGNGSVINEGITSYIISLNNVINVTFDNFNIINTTPATNVFGFSIRGGSQYISITNNFMDVGTVSTGTANSGIVASNSLTSPTTVGDNAQYLTITNNEIVGGYYGISLYGNSNYLNNYGHVISDNIIRDFYLYGIRINDGDTITIARNDINRATRAGLSTFYGIYTLRGRNMKVFDNHIHSSGVGSYTAYPIYHSGSENSIGYETEYINNAIYNIRSSSTTYGMYLLGTRNYVNIYHNTVQLEATGSSAMRALWMSTAPNFHNVRNNLFSIEGAGTGIKFCIYIGATSTSLNANNNVYYMGATAGTNHIGYWTADRTTLLDWQTATSQDALSTDANPVFASILLGNITPLSAAIDNMGAPVGVLTDIFGSPRSTTTPDVGAIEFTGLSADIALLGGELVNGECLSTNDSIYVTISNVIGSTVNFSTATLTAHWSVTGPVNSNGIITINSGTLAPAAEMTVGAAGVDLSVPGDYTLDVYISANSVNTFIGNDTIMEAYDLTIRVPFAVSPKEFIVTSSTDTVEISATSQFLPGGGFFISEICHWRGSSTGVPVGGWPSYLIADDYIEITGVPNSDLAGYTLEQYDGSSMLSTYTFPAGTVIGPNGTATFAVGQMGADVPVPSSYHYHANGGYTGSFGSTTPAGRILRDGSGNIIDAVGYGNYTFPASANVTPADWSGNTPAISSAGNKLAGPYTKDATNWVNSGIDPMDPNVLNAGVTLPVAGTLTGFTWSYNGVVTSNNVVDTVVGPWSTNGVYQYVASFITPCGVLTDTVTIITSFLIVSSDTAICHGDSVELYVDFPGTGPWTIIMTDGTTIDTISGIPVSPVSMFVSPSVTTTYQILGYMDASNVLVPSSESVTVTVHPLPTVTITGFDICEYEASVTLTGGMPAGGVYMGTGVTAGEFDPAIAGVGTHIITYHYTDVNGCENFADTVADVHPAPTVALGSDFDVCADGSAIIDAGTGFDTYLWSTGATTAMITVDGAVIGLGNTQTFTVTVTNTFGCEGEDEVNVTAIDCTGIEELAGNGNLVIWPNPSNGNLNIEISGIHGDATMRIFRSTGEVVAADHMTVQGGTTRAINLEHLSAGIYYIQIITLKGTITEKLMIK